MYVLKDSDEKVDQQYVGNQQIASHDSRDNPGAGLAGWQRHHHTVLCGDVLPTGGFAPPRKKQKETQKLIQSQPHRETWRPSCTISQQKFVGEQHIWNACKRKKKKRDTKANTQYGVNTNRIECTHTYTPWRLVTRQTIKGRKNRKHDDILFANKQEA